MALSIKHQLQRWTVQQLNRVGFTNVTLSTPLPTRGDGSTFYIDDDNDVHPSQLRQQHSHSRAHAETNIYAGPQTYYPSQETSSLAATRRQGNRALQLLPIRGLRGLVSLLVVLVVFWVVWKVGWLWSGLGLRKVSRQDVRKTI